MFVTSPPLAPPFRTDFLWSKGENAHRIGRCGGTPFPFPPAKAKRRTGQGKGWGWSLKDSAIELPPK
ncbi:MAG: hypothetical protein B6D64_05860 [Bacteroidetes bacterium 4484_276]|nr:MAG: hypothetical protein B6D64_05860 [Bacteroidetes bacterium 4484_276]